METIINKIEQHYYAYKSICVDPPEFRITHEEKAELLNHLFTIFPIIINKGTEKQDEFMGVKLVLVEETK